METEILQQRAAASLNVEASVMALSVEHASELFSKATHRLLNISKWHTLPCSLLTTLKLTDNKGREVSDRQVRENDYFVVGNDSGDGEWVKVEKVYLQRDPSGPREMVTVRARPSSHPFNNEESTRPSNTFKVMRSGLNITVSVYGQNEEDEINTSKPADDKEISRPDSTVGAIPGVARVQWRSLVNGILSTWKD